MKKFCEPNLAHIWHLHSRRLFKAFCTHVCFKNCYKMLQSRSVLWSHWTNGDRCWCWVCGWKASQKQHYHWPLYCTTLETEVLFQNRTSCIDIVFHRACWDYDVASREIPSPHHRTTVPRVLGTENYSIISTVAHQDTCTLHLTAGKTTAKSSIFKNKNLRHWWSLRKARTWFWDLLHTDPKKAFQVGRG